jgi:hypothetical protein
MQKDNLPMSICCKEQRIERKGSSRDMIHLYACLPPSLQLPQSAARAASMYHPSSSGLFETKGVL